MANDERLVKKGQRQPRLGLVEQGKVSVGLAREYATALAAVGWSKADTNAMEALVTELEGDIAVQAENRANSLNAHRGELTAIDGAKTFIRVLSRALPRVLRATSTGVTLADFSTHGALRRSTPKISGYLARIRPHVAVLDKALGKAFGGQSALAQLDQVKGALDAADTIQEVSVKALPADTAALSDVKGKLLEAIEDLNRAGKNAFDGDPAMVGIWNKKVLARARRRRKPTEPAPAPTPVAPTPLPPMPEAVGK